MAENRSFPKRIGSNDSNGIVLSFISSQSSQGSSHISLSQLTVTISLTCVVRRQTTDDRGSGNVRSPCFKSATSGVHHIQEQRGLGTIFRRERGLSSNGGFSSGDGTLDEELLKGGKLELQFGASLSPSTATVASAGTSICWKDLPQPLQEEVPPTAIPTPIPAAGGDFYVDTACKLGFRLCESGLCDALISELSFAVIFLGTVTSNGLLLDYGLSCQTLITDYKCTHLRYKGNEHYCETMGSDIGIHQEPVSQDSFLTMRVAQPLILCR
nr:hypothetical protein Iba_chr10dCG13280 [Ipomoea batatas]